MRRPEQRAVQRVGPRVVRAAQRARGGAHRLRSGRAGEQLRAAVPADVVRRVQAALLVAGDQDRLPHHVDDRDPTGLVQPEVGAPADAEPLAVQHPVALDARTRPGRRTSPAAAPPGGHRVPHATPSGDSVPRRHQVAGAAVALARGQHRQRRTATRLLDPGGGRLARARAPGQRGWKRQPDGIRVGSGTSPSRTTGSSALHLRYDGQQRLRVGVLRRGEHLLGRARPRRSGRGTSPRSGRRCSTPGRGRGSPPARRARARCAA